MTRRLILIRHAKSGWDDVYADDHARALTDRGRKAARAIGAWLAEIKAVPDIILTSDAVRTLETTKRLVTGLQKSVKTEAISALYHAAPQTLLATAKAAKGKTVAVVGHNPGIAMAASAVVRQAPTHPRFQDYPTCATTVIDFADEDWCAPGAGKVVAFTVPRDL